MYYDKENNTIHMSMADYWKIECLFKGTYSWIDDVEIQLNGRDISTITIYYDESCGEPNA